MTFTLGQLEFFLAILVRISTFVYTAPFFSINSVPQRVKIGISVMLAYVVFTMLPYEPLEYAGSLGYALLVAKEAIAGLMMGLFANISNRILSFAGQLIDMEIGFSMANEFDPTTKMTVSLSSNLYNYSVMLIMLVSRMHFYIIDAVVDSFQVIPTGNVVLHGSVYELMLQYITDFCVIGFRIALPVFATLMIVNTVLGILARVAPQMNMFVVGMQLKVLIGLAVMIIMILNLDSISDFIFNEMMLMLKSVIQYLH
ncbi:MAG: flagellar biosynthetic protein FliR [Lachnospiraceae bacterium]|nr:flagellar biosynthetic protein FliR [Lachnospiraceae bacterium]